MTAVFLRIFGSVARYEVMERVYRGVGDAADYYRKGQAFAQRIWAFDFSVLSPDVWFSGGWWGTQFLRNLSGLALSIVGPSMRAEFLLFSLASFVGLFALALAFSRAYPVPIARRYTTFLWLWPSLWFWPSSVGKEAVVIFGIGIAVLGFVGRKARPTWWLMTLGTGLVFCIRPHMALVIALSGAAASWLGSWRGFTARRFVEVVAAVVISVVAFQAMLVQFGLGDVDLEGMQEFAEFRAEQSHKGGSNIGGVGLSVAGVPMAVINVWFRPFLWEAHNPMAAVAAMEMLLFWYLIWRNRRGLKPVLKNWRKSRLIAFAIPFLVLFTFMIGLVMGNMGLLARQRTPIFPFAFMVIAAGMVAVPVRRRIAGRWAAPPSTVSPHSASRQ